MQTITNEQMRNEEKNMNAKIIALCNQKGGCSKTTTTISLGTGLARQGKKVLLVDLDPQANLTQGLGFNEPDSIEYTIYDVLASMVKKTEIPYIQDIILKSEGIDLIPSGIVLAAIEVQLVNTMSRERKVKQFLDTLRDSYDYILIDTMPSLGLLTLNAMVAADSVIIPVQAQFFSAKGLELLINTITDVRNELNHNLAVDGILITMIQEHTNFGRDILGLIKQAYGDSFRIFKNRIPLSIKAAETSAYGQSLYHFDRANKAAQAYEGFVKEVLKVG
jgi:chromosome partitioning protein